MTDATMGSVFVLIFTSVGLRFQKVVARPLPHRYLNRGKKVDEDEVIQINRLSDFLTSDSCGKVEYGFVNYHDNPIKMYWINQNTNDKIYNQELGKGERNTAFITTFVGHKFEFYDSEPNEDALQNERILELTVGNHGIIGIKNHDQPHVPKEDVVEEVKRTLNNEWRRHLRVKRTFSSLGFDKGKLPDDLFASLGSYYYNNRDPPHKVLEEWGRHKGVFVNYWETDVSAELHNDSEVGHRNPSLAFPCAGKLHSNSLAFETSVARTTARADRGVGGMRA